MNKRMKVLIAYDGSACADAALDDLQRAGLPREAEALVVSVTEAWLPLPPPSSYEMVDAAIAGDSSVEFPRQYFNDLVLAGGGKSRASHAKKRLQRVFPEWEVEAEAFYGSPAHEIIRRANQWKPHLLVVGSHGRSTLGRYLLGSVSHKVVAEAQTSVRVARGRIEIDHSPVRIILGVDGSPGSEEAVRVVASRAWPSGTEARILVVEEPFVPSAVERLFPPVTRWIEESNNLERGWVKKITDVAARQLRASKLAVSVSVKEGDPKRLLVDEALEWGADCLFVGSTGFSNRFERFMLGSVSAHVAAHAHCSVEVVRYVTADRAGPTFAREHSLN